MSSVRGNGKSLLGQKGWIWIGLKKKMWQYDSLPFGGSVDDAYGSTVEADAIKNYSYSRKCFWIAELYAWKG